MEGLTFDEDRIDRGSFGKSEMSAICRKYDRTRVLIDRPRGGLEFPIEKLIEMSEGVDRTGELFGRKAVGVDEWLNFRPRRRVVHAAAIPCGESGAFDVGVKGDFPQRIAIGERKERLTIDLFGFDLAGEAIKKLNCGHGRNMREFLRSGKENRSLFCGKASDSGPAKNLRKMALFRSLQYGVGGARSRRRIERVEGNTKRGRNHTGGT